MATDKNGVNFAEGQKVKVVAKGASPWSLHQAGSYEGTVVGLHEDGAHIQVGDGKTAYRIAPLASECEIV